MDSSSHNHQHHQSWLGFSLSNHHLRMPSSSDASNQLCLFEYQAFNTSQNRGEENGGGATDLSMFTCGSPKLEDFLGTCGSSGSQSADVCQFTGGNETSAVYNTADQLYDSDLKTLASSFLRGFSAEQSETQKQLVVAPPLEPPVKKTGDNFGQRTSIYRGVTRHRWTGRYEAHLWDNSCRREGQSRKGRQVYLGGYDKEDKAARAYDLAALKYWGPTTTTNFPVCNYEKELEDMKNMTRQEFVASLRRKSSGFSRGASIYRGVTRHHQHGRWQARIGRVAGNKDLYLGTFSTQEEAAEAYDIAAIKFRGLNAVTNFDMSRYDVKSIASSNLPVGGMTNKSKTTPDQSGTSDNKYIDSGNRSDDHDLSTSSSVTFASQPSTSTLSFALQPIKQDPSDYWSMLAYNNQQNSVLNNNSRNSGYNPGNDGIIQGATPFSMDFSTSSTENHNVGFSSGDGGNYMQQQSYSGATQIALNSNNNSGYYEGGVYANFGNWMAPSVHHPIQPAKVNNLSLYQTPIFGTE